MTKVRFKLPAPPAAREFELSTGQAAVEALSPDAVTVVLGSPASGKTTAVRALVQSSLARGLQADQILVLAANREAANALRDQIAIDLQTATPGPMARTLTSFAFGLLRQRAISNGQKLPELISGSEQDRILAEVLAHAVEGGTDGLGFPKHINQLVLGLNGFRAELRDLVTVALEHGVSPDGLSQLGALHSKPEWQAASKLYEQYLNFVSKPEYEGRFDASMLLREATLILQASDSRSIKLVIVDDAVVAFVLEVLFVPEVGVEDVLLDFVFAEVTAAGLAKAGPNLVGSRAVATEIADCTSRAAASMLRPRSNSSVIAVRPSVEEEVILVRQCY